MPRHAVAEVELAGRRAAQGVRLAQAIPLVAARIPAAGRRRPDAVAARLDPGEMGEVRVPARPVIRAAPPEVLRAVRVQPAHARAQLRRRVRRVQRPVRRSARTPGLVGRVPRRIAALQRARRLPGRQRGLRSATEGRTRRARRHGRRRLSGKRPRRVRRAGPPASQARQEARPTEQGAHRPGPRLQCGRSASSTS